jgi:hypothetical protein
VALAAPQQPQLHPSPVIVMTEVTDAVVAAGSAEAHLTQHLAGKRKVSRQDVPFGFSYIQCHQTGRIALSW